MSRYSASEIGRQLKEARQVRGLAVAAAAKVMRVSREMVYKYEEGKSLPSLDVLTRAANAWGISFKLAGCEVIPRPGIQRRAKQAQPVQQFLPFGRARRYKGASLKIRQHGSEIIITAVVRNTP
jgi:transcriptional regulator with XRE-family HTH domain